MSRIQLEAHDLALKHDAAPLRRRLHRAARMTFKSRTSSCAGSESEQTLQGSFSAVSKPIFAIKYSFESSRRDLHNTLLCTAFRSQIFVKNFAEIKEICEILMKNLRQESGAKECTV